MDQHINACLNLLKKQDVASQGSAESPLMYIIKRETGEVVKIDIYTYRIRRPGKTPYKSIFYSKTAVDPCF
ncbi:hypothetical protein KEJ48_06220 [Candidatus Bathyarchaeota archaeon]|nr:hypothetical protein [Candidatus Bathyarchaeota archaeon]